MATALTEQTVNIEQAKTFETFSLEEVAKHGSLDDCWVISGSGVYDVTTFLAKHPGGRELIVNNAGTDVTQLLDDPLSHEHSVHAYNVLKQYKVGEFESTEASGISHDSSGMPLVLQGWNEDVVDWNRGLLFQVHRFGDEYLKWVFSPVDRHMRMFDSNFIEFFSRTKWYAVPLLWLPVALICSVLAFNELKTNHYSSSSSSYTTDDNTSTLHITTVFLSLVLSGIPLWTVIEYLLHRYLFHLEPRGNSPLQITLHFFFHGQHHKVPFDEDRLVFPPVAASVFIFIFWASMNLLLPGGSGSCIFAGGILGYVHYDMMHYYMHHGSPRVGSYLHDMKAYHVSHHFHDPSRGFGISTKFWDFPFNTVGKKKH